MPTKFPLRSPWRTALMLSLAVGLRGVSMPAQSAPADGVIRVESRLVSLDVSVLDAHGNLVRDLTREDFTIFENGARQSIHSFEAFSDHRLPEGMTANSISTTADLQRVAPNSPVTVLVLDEFNTDFTDTAFARSSIRRYLLSQSAVLSQPTSFLVATDDGFQQVVDYTLDRGKLLDGLQHLPGVLPRVLMRTGGSAEGRALRFAQTLMSLEQIAQASVGHKGRKNIVWVGRGFDSIDLRDATDRQLLAVKGSAERAVNILREAHASLYTIDPTLSTKLIGSKNVDETTADPDIFVAETHDVVDPFEGTVSFNTLAPQTGGRSFAIYNDVDAEIGTSIAEGSSFYTLTYVPKGAIDPLQPYRGIIVTVDRPGMVVVTRRGYYSVTPPPPTRTSAQELKAQGFDIGSALNSGIAYTGLGVKVSRSVTNASQCVVQVTSKDLDWEAQTDGSMSVRLVVAAVGVDAKGHFVGKTAKEVVMKLPAGKSLADVAVITLQVDLPSSTKPVTHRIAVRDQSTGKMGTSELRP